MHASQGVKIFRNVTKNPLNPKQKLKKKNYNIQEFLPLNPQANGLS